MTKRQYSDNDKANILGRADIYGVRAIDRKEPFYIGSTRCGLERRWTNHRSEVLAGTHKNPHFASTCKKIGFDNLICERIETVPEDAQFYREYEVINEYLARGVRLTNIRLNVGSERMSLAEYYAVYYTQPHIFQENILTWLHDLKANKPHIAQNPAQQGLSDKMRYVLELLVESLVTKHASGFCAMMRGEPCPT